MYKDFERVLKAAAEVGVSNAILSKDPEYVKVLSTLAMFYVEVANQKLAAGANTNNTSKNLNTMSLSFPSAPASRVVLVSAGDLRDPKMLLQEATEFTNRCDAIDSRFLWGVIAKGWCWRFVVLVGVCFRSHFACHHSEN